MDFLRLSTTLSYSGKILQVSFTLVEDCTKLIQDWSGIFQTYSRLAKLPDLFKTFQVSPNLFMTSSKRFKSCSRFVKIFQNSSRFFQTYSKLIKTLYSRFETHYNSSNCSILVTDWVRLFTISQVSFKIMEDLLSLFTTFSRLDKIL